jgi:hypothetical protein
MIFDGCCVIKFGNLPRNSERSNMKRWGKFPNIKTDEFSVSLVSVIEIH